MVSTCTYGNDTNHSTLGPSNSITSFSSPSVKNLMQAGGKMVVNITSIMGNGRHDRVFKNRSVDFCIELLLRK